MPYNRLGWCLARRGDCLGHFVLSFLLPWRWCAFFRLPLLRWGVGVVPCLPCGLACGGVSHVLCSWGTLSEDQCSFWGLGWLSSVLCGVRCGHGFCGASRLWVGLHVGCGVALVLGVAG